ncbi:MAG: hypothetical protein GY928_26535, partial [Colwellia sp.]|nr:hypothetical protein [Colwellia sp.]
AQADIDANELASDNAEAALQTELDGTQTGAGLGTDGTYTANGAANYISTSTSLVDATEDLDTQVATNAAAITSGNAALQTEVDAIETGAGLNTDGTYTANGAATYISTSADLQDADDDLDVALAAAQADIDANELASDNAEAALQTELDGTQTGAGLGTDGTYTANGAANY